MHEIRPRGDMVEGWKAPDISYQTPKPNKEKVVFKRDAGVPASELEDGIEDALRRDADQLAKEIAALGGATEGEEKDRLQPVA